MSILLIGARGNMGRRYAAIFKYLGLEYVGVDQEHNPAYVDAEARKSEGILIATPTDTHVDLVRRMLPSGKPILCEKPITKDVLVLRTLMEEIKRSRTPFRMINQYRMLADHSRIGRSHYNYFKHGNDGLYWDCLQIIGLATGDLTLGEDSPMWRCMINGKAISLAHMDAAYIAYIQHWMKYPIQDPGQIIHAHEKTSEMDRKARTAQPWPNSLT